MKIQYQNYKYPYLYETHLHTSQGSLCGRATGAQMAEACKAWGYTGIIVTDHFMYGNTAIDRNLPWTQWVELFSKGYEDAFSTGKKIGLQVFFGWESGYNGTEFLVYGLDKEWLIKHPEIKDASIEEQYHLVHNEGGMVIHAHPFRKEEYIPQIVLCPNWVDGVEVVNATHSNFNSTSHKDLEADQKALEYAHLHQLSMTAGSDIHKIELFGGGIASHRKFRDIYDFIVAVTQKEDYLLKNGNEELEIK